MTLMKWIKASEGLPLDASEILVRDIDESVNLGCYDRKKDRFILCNGSIIDYRGKKVFWMELARSESDLGK
jgi:hypothetical protein